MAGLLTSKNDADGLTERLTIADGANGFTAKNDADGLTGCLTIAGGTNGFTAKNGANGLTKRLKIPRGAIECIAVSIGPGSFTGLRIGLAAAKALSYAWDVPIIGVPTLEALANNFPFDRVLTLLDAQRNCAYYQFFDRMKAIDEIKVDAIDRIMEMAGATADRIVVCGDVLEKIKKAPSNVELAPMNLRMPRAVNVGLVGRRMMSDGLIDNVMNLEPKYVRRSEAEVLWEKRHSPSE